MKKARKPPAIEVQFTEKSAWKEFTAGLKEKMEQLVRQGKAKKIK